MPVDTSSYQKYYNALQQAYGKEGVVEKGAFNLGYDDFKQKLSNQDYAQKIYHALDQAYGNQGAAERGAFTIPFDDFYKKISAPPTQQPTGPVSQPPSIADVFRPVREAGPSIAPPSHLLDGTLLDQHSKEVQRAANNLTQTFNEHKDKAIHDIVKKDLTGQLQSMSGRMGDDAISQKGLDEQRQKLWGRLINPTPDIANYKQDMAADQSKVRQVVSQISENHPDKAAQLKADMYLLDSQKRPEKAGLILNNAHAIANNKGIDYDVKKGNLTKQEGFFESLGQGFSERNRMMKDYDQYANGAPADVINKLEGQRASYDPDLPVNTPYGIGGHLGSAIGSQGIVTAKGAAAAGLTSLIPVAGEVAAPWVAAAATSPEFYKTGYVSSLENEYHRLRNQGVHPEEALTKAREKASFDAKVDVAQGAISTVIGTRIGLKPGELSPTFQNSIKNIALHSGKWLMETGIEGSSNAVIGAGLQELKNIHAGRPAEEGAFETGMGQLMFTYGLGALTKGGRALLNPKAYSSILRTMARAPEGEINSHLAQMVRDGSLTEQDATEVHGQLSAQRDLDNRIPPEISSDKDRAKIQELIQQRDALDAKLESVDKAYHPELKEQIKTLNEKIATIGKEPSPEEVRPSTEPTFQSPEDQAKVEAAKQTIQSQLKPEEHGQETERDAQTQEIGKATEKPTEGAPTEQAAAPSYLLSRHADTIKDEEGKISSDNQHPLSAKGKRDANDLANEVQQHAEQTGVPITRVVTTGLERSIETGNKVAAKTGAKVENDSKLNTWKTGEFDNTKDEDWKRIQKWFVEHPTETEYKPEDKNDPFYGKKMDESFDAYANRTIEAHKPYENEPASTLLIDHSNNMMVMEAYRKNGNQWNEQARQDYLNAEKPEPATLTNKTQDNALQIGRPEEVLQREQSPDASAGGERGRMEQGQQGNVPAGESGGQPAQEEGAGEKAAVPPSKGDDWPFVEPSKTGIAERVKKEREFDAGVKAPEPGEGASVQAMVDRGRELLANGEDAEKVMQDFEKDPKKNISADGVALVRAKLEQLAKATDKAIEEHGEESKEAEAARQAESAWAERIQPMQTEWSKIGQGQQGSVDLATGSVTTLKRAFREVSGKPLTEKQSAQAKEYHDNIKERDKKIETLQKQLDELHKGGSVTPEKGTAQKAKDLAKRIRDKAKINRPDVFSAATPASLVWDSAVEVVAKSIEAGGTIAEAIAKGVEHIKSSDWYKGLSEAKQKQAEKKFTDWHNKAEEKTPEEKKIERLEKELSDLQQGKAKQKAPATKDSDKAKQLREQIKDEKAKLGLSPSKAEKPEEHYEVNRFADKKDNNFTSEESKALWEKAKEVIKNGETDFHNVINQVAMDSGLTNEQVRRAIAQPKGAKVVTDKMYAEMYRRNQVLQSAKIWVKSADLSTGKKFWGKVIKVPSAIVTALHGSVAPITHVGGDLWRPLNWKSYFNFMIDSYKFSFGGVTEAGKARYEKAMGDLVRDPMYIMAKRAGLRIDPTDYHSDDYSNYQSVFGRLAKMGERGFNAMKPYRLEQFKKIYNSLPDQAKANADVVKAAAHIVNLQSGTTEAKIPPGTDLVMFAPKLVVSQYQRIFTEPAKAIGTFLNWEKATDAQKLQAKMVAKHSAQMVGTYLAGLAANQAILSLTGSNQSINFTNPLASDWMKFKIKGKAIDASGGMNSALRFVASLAEEGLRANGVIKTEEKGKPGDAEGRKIIQQAANKLSPAAGDIAELFSGTDNLGNPLPWSSVKPSAGKEKLTWDQYFESKSPIFIAEGFKTFNEAAKDNGMPNATLNNYLEGIVIGILAGTTGAHIGPDVSLKPKKGSDDRGGGDTGAGGSGGGFDR